MSETNNNNFQVPPNQDFDTVGFQGSMQQILQDNTGNYVIIDFLIGSENLVTKQGILYNVGSQFVVLYDALNSWWVVCDIFAVKFVTFLMPNHRPGQVLNSAENTDGADGDVPSDVLSPTMTASSVMNRARMPSQAAYAHAVRNSRR